MLNCVLAGAPHNCIIFHFAAVSIISLREYQLRGERNSLRSRRIEVNCSVFDLLRHVTQSFVFSFVRSPITSQIPVPSIHPVDNYLAQNPIIISEKCVWQHCCFKRERNVDFMIIWASYLHLDFSGFWYDACRLPGPKQISHDPTRNASKNN